MKNSGSLLSEISLESLRAMSGEMILENLRLFRPIRCLLKDRRDVMIEKLQSITM